VFGTGKFFEDTDPADVKIQSVYAVRDPGNLKVSLQRSNLTAWTINETGNKRYVTKSGATQRFGWYADLSVSSVAAGERVVATPLLLGGNAYFSTVEVNGSDPCVPKVNGWIMAFDFELGSNPLADVFGTVPAGGKLINAAGTRTVLDPKEGPPLGEITALSTAGGIVISAGGSGTNRLPVPDTRRQGRSTWKQFQ
jgi:Tfp pilus tip-associated adhesin PilY1